MENNGNKYSVELTTLDMEAIVNALHNYKSQYSKNIDFDLPKGESMENDFCLYIYEHADELMNNINELRISKKRKTI